ncbi:MAG: ABC transporter substrate-binding protein [Nitrospinota bacterium]|nr:MAG: ABC transporter substrate-binding protein [Nitrospinota bacterium]
MTRRTVFWCFFVLTALAFIFPAQGATPKQGGVLIIGRGGDSVGLDPALEDDGESFKVADNLFDTLVDYADEDTSLRPELAESWSISADGLRYTFTLREGVVFHDGTPLDADAVVFSFARQAPIKYKYFGKGFPLPKEQGPYKYWGYMSMSDIVASVEARDARTVVFTLKRPEAPFLSNLGMNFSSIVSPTAVLKLGADFRRKPVGSGPFKFVQWIKDDRIILEANERYWDGRPYLDRVIFRSIPDNSTRLLELLSGAIDVMHFPNPSDIPLIEKEKNLKVLRQPGMNIGYLAMNMDKKPFDNRKVRLAINHAINKQAIIDTIYEGLGTVAKNPIPPMMWGYNDEVEDYRYDPALARKLLTEAGYPNGFQTTLWAMPVPRPYNPNGRKVAEAIQADLRKIGIEARIVSYEWGTYLDKTERGEHDMALLGWTGDNGDPDNFFYILLDKESARIPAGNIAFYRSDELHEILVKAKTSTDQAERERLYKQACVIVHRDAPWVPLAHSIQVVPMKKGVQNYKLHPTTKHRLGKVWKE